MNWHDLAPAYVLGTLEPQEAAAFEQQLHLDAELRAEVQRYQETVGELPLAVEPHAPPPHVKAALMARVQTAAQVAPVAPRVAEPIRRWWQRLSWPLINHVALVAAVLAIALLGAALFNTSEQLRVASEQNAQFTRQLADNEEVIADLRREQQTLNADLATARQNEQQASADLANSSTELAKIQTQIQTNQQALTFLAANDLATRPLAHSATASQAEGTMFMRPGDAEAVVLVRGLPALDRSRTYQFWLATGTQQVNAGMLIIDADGNGRLIFNAPAPVDNFVQVMVTVEQNPQATSPSEEVVLQGTLT